MFGWVKSLQEQAEGRVEAARARVARAEAAQMAADRAREAEVSLAAARAEVDRARRAEVTLEGELAAQRERAEAYDRAVPRPLQIAAGWSWRVLLVVALFLALGWGSMQLSSVTIPLAIGVMLTAGLYPVCSRLVGWGLPRVVAAAVTLVGGLLLFAGVVTLIVTQIVSQGDELVRRTTEGVNQLLAWLNTGPLKITPEQQAGWLRQLTDFLQEQQAAIATYAASGAGAVGNFLAGAVMAVFAMFFMLYDGPRIWDFLMKLVPHAARPGMDGGARRGWKALVDYVRATVVVAAVDAIGPLVAAIAMGVPMAPALGALLFVAAFIPIVGLLVAGFVVTVITLVTVGWVQALIMLAVIVGVNQLESNFLQPMLLGKAVSLHPLAILFGIALGISVGGIVGALLVVPIMAFAKTFIEYVARGGASQVTPAVSPAGSGTP